MLLTSIFSFSHNVFYPFQKKFPFFCHIYFVILLSANAFNLDQPKILSFGKELTLYSIDTHFDTSATDSFWNNTGKGEIAHNKQFLLFLQCLLLNQIVVSPFVHAFDIISLFAA